MWPLPVGHVAALGRPVVPEVNIYWDVSSTPSFGRDSRGHAAISSVTGDNISCTITLTPVGRVGCCSYVP